VTVICHVAAVSQSKVAVRSYNRLAFAGTVAKAGVMVLHNGFGVPHNGFGNLEIARECVPRVVDYCAAESVIEMLVLSTGISSHCQTGEVLAV
jgi:hypothetical protein